MTEGIKSISEGRIKGKLEFFGDENQQKQAAIRVVRGLIEDFDIDLDEV